MGRGGSCQACRKRFVEGDPSLMLAPAMDCPMAPHLTLWLSGQWFGDGLALGLPFVCMRWEPRNHGNGQSQLCLMDKSVIRVV